MVHLSLDLSNVLLRQRVLPCLIWRSIDSIIVVDTEFGICHLEYVGIVCCEYVAITRQLLHQERLEIFALAASDFGEVNLVVLGWVCRRTIARDVLINII